MARKKDWSLIDAQMEMRDSQDRQGRFHSPAFEVRDKVDPGYLYDGPPIMRHLAFGERMPSPDRLRERTRPRYGEETYSLPDLSSLGLGETKSGWPTPASAREIAVTPSWRPGSIEFENPDIPTRRMVNAGFKPSPERRQASTESAFRAADASMFESTVTPKAAPIKDYKPRGKTVRDKNIQAFY